MTPLNFDTFLADHKRRVTDPLAEHRRAARTRRVRGTGRLRRGR